MSKIGWLGVARVTRGHRK